MPVDGVGSSTASQILYQRNDVSATSKELTTTDFYKLMAAQMKYQDPDSPMDTSELMAQMVQAKMITAVTQMTSTNITSYATSMVGKEVTVAEIDERGAGTGQYTTGTVTGVVLGDNPILYVDGKAYGLSQVMSVGNIPTEGTSQEKPEGGESNSGSAGEA